MYNAIYSPLMKLAALDVRKDPTEEDTSSGENNESLKEKSDEIMNGILNKNTEIFSVEQVVLETPADKSFDANANIITPELFSPPTQGATLTTQMETVVSEQNKKLMESEVQQSKSVDMISTESSAVLENSTLETQSLPSLTNERLIQWQQISGNLFDFLKQLPKYSGRFFTEYQLPILCFASIITATIAIKLVIAVLDVINEIPQLQLLFELTGIGSATWFFFRYLLKASTRKELAAQIRSIQKEIVEVKDS
ncbi:MAG: nitrogenase vanadium-iron protein subunit alpha/delta, partial [Brasilonema octagenarum HA4186-MV1]|jgi:hypothetical protein|nr:nitrogenase vanadium-iron protein subunit alpha/delta [Brasilonema octagenarum HA4186-MV1]